MKGKKTGGRKKGSLNKVNAERRVMLTEAQLAGLTPLEYMLAVLRDKEQKPATRMVAAQNAAPYIHPKLASVDHGNKDGKPLALAMLDVNDAVRAQALAEFMAKVGK